MPSKDALIQLLKNALYFDPSWVGAQDDVVLKEVNWSYIGKDQRDDLQRAGKAHGCHVCGKKIEDNPDDQVWTADHQPPVKLSASAIVHYQEESKLNVTSSEVRLYPQCTPCSKKQSVLIKAIDNSAPGGNWISLTPDQQRLIEGHECTSKTAKNYIVTTATKATQTERDLIQKLGKTFGCHTCGTKIPVTDYEADHAPPATLFHYTWSKKLIKYLGIVVKELKIRPACGSCQRAQGGTVKKVLTQCAQYIYEQGLNIIINTPGYSRHEVGLGNSK